MYYFKHKALVVAVGSVLFAGGASALPVIDADFTGAFAVSGLSVVDNTFTLTLTGANGFIDYHVPAPGSNYKVIGNGSVTTALDPGFTHVLQNTSYNQTTLYQGEVQTSGITSGNIKLDLTSGTIVRDGTSDGRPSLPSDPQAPLPSGQFTDNTGSFASFITGLVGGVVPTAPVGPVSVEYALNNAHVATFKISDQNGVLEQYLRDQQAANGIPSSAPLAGYVNADNFTITAGIATELRSLNLEGTGLLPMGRDLSGVGGNDGYEFVNTEIKVSLSGADLSDGLATLTFDGTHSVDGRVNQWDSLHVDSYFNINFDVSLRDIDPVHDFAAPTGSFPDGTTISIPSDATVVYVGDCIANLYKINYGCLPPIGEAYIGHGLVIIPLGFDVNGNGFDDVLKFTLVQHLVGQERINFIEGVNLIDVFESTGVLGGAVNDLISDPPFSVSLSGPTTASQTIIAAAIPAPSLVALIGMGVGILGWMRKGRR